MLPLILHFLVQLDAETLVIVGYSRTLLLLCAYSLCEAQRSVFLSPPIRYY